VRAENCPRAHHKPAGHGLRHRQATQQQTVQSKRLQFAGSGHGVRRGSEIRTGYHRGRRHAQSWRRGDGVQRGGNEDEVSRQQEVSDKSLSKSLYLYHMCAQVLLRRRNTPKDLIEPEVWTTPSQL